MNEDILSFIWRYQYFETASLTTDEGLKLSILRPGHINTDAGPDFLNARIQISEVVWAGSVEIHVKSSDWFLHDHSSDGAYENVILHVVWENDKLIERKDGTFLPTLSLKGIVRKAIIERYYALIDEQDEIPCHLHFQEVSELTKISMLDRVLIERLEQKASGVLELFYQNKQDWEETAYQWICQHFGFKLNNPAFLRLSTLLPYKIIRKYKDNLNHIEALLFGSAGLIPPMRELDVPNLKEDQYPKLIADDYQFLSHKHRLNAMNTHEWKFLRLRPTGFPTIRLAQLAQLLQRTNGLYNVLTNSDYPELQKLFCLKQSDYWQKHFLFYKPAQNPIPKMGKDAVDLLIINGAIPLLIASSKYYNEPKMLDKALQILAQIPAENNKITRKWASLGMKVSSAGDSQSLIQWHHAYCVQKQCLQCSVGSFLIRGN